MAEGETIYRIRISKELLEQLFTRDAEGNRLRIELGPTNSDGSYTPTVEVDYGDNVVAACLKPMLDAFTLDPAEVAAMDWRQAVDMIRQLLELP